MNNSISTIDLSLISDASLETIAKKVISEFVEADKSPATFSLKDVTRAMTNFQVAAKNALAGDDTAIAIRDLAKEALVSVLFTISDKDATVLEKLKLS